MNQHDQITQKYCLDPQSPSGLAYKTDILCGPKGKEHIRVFAGEPIGYISQDELNVLLSGKVGNHMTVGLDTREAWPIGSNESVPYDWLVAIYITPRVTQVNQQIAKLLEKCVILIDELSGDIEVAYIENLIRESEDALNAAKSGDV